MWKNRVVYFWHNNSYNNYCVSMYIYEILSKEMLPLKGGEGDGRLLQLRLVWLKEVKLNTHLTYWKVKWQIKLLCMCNLSSHLSLTISHHKFRFKSIKTFLEMLFCSRSGNDLPLFGCVGFHSTADTAAGYWVTSTNVYLISAHQQCWLHQFFFDFENFSVSTVDQIYSISCLRFPIISATEKFHTIWFVRLAEQAFLFFSNLRIAL